VIVLGRYLLYKYKLAQKYVIVVIWTVTLFFAASGSALAGYGPPCPPSSSPVPGGYYCIVTSQTVGPAGKIIGPLRIDKLRVTLRVRKDTFMIPVQITITEPYGNYAECQGRGIGDAGFPGYRFVGGVGILVQLNGCTYQGTFPKPLTLRIRSRSISRSSIVVAWNGTVFAKVRHAVVRKRSAKVRIIHASSHLAVLTPISRSRTVALRRESYAATQAPRLLDEELAAVLFMRAGSPVPGLGVLEPAWLHAFAAIGHGGSSAS
jgi:hypothetical protein